MTAPNLTPALSIVIPAYNESGEIATTLERVRESFTAAGFDSYEIIVSDDASTDGTGEIAEALGARVVCSGRRIIGATRNAGAAVAQGKYLLFLDADTHVTPGTILALVEAMDRDVIGGGALIRWNQPVPWHAQIPLSIWNRTSRILRWPAGSFLFVRREVFEEIGGFDTQFLAGEEIVLGRHLKRRGKPVILKEPVYTSPRKIHLFSHREMLQFLLQWIRAPRQTLQRRELLDYWYSRRD